MEYLLLIFLLITYLLSILIYNWKISLCNAILITILLYELYIIPINNIVSNGFLNSYIEDLKGGVAVLITILVFIWGLFIYKIKIIKKINKIYKEKNIILKQYHKKSFIFIIKIIFLIIILRIIFYSYDKIVFEKGIIINNNNIKKVYIKKNIIPNSLSTIILLKGINYNKIAVSDFDNFVIYDILKNKYIYKKETLNYYIKDIYCNRDNNYKLLIMNKDALHNGIHIGTLELKSNNINWYLLSNEILNPEYEDINDVIYCNTNNDSKNEFIFNTGDNKIYIIDKTGNIKIWTFEYNIKEIMYIGDDFEYVIAFYDKPNDYDIIYIDKYGQITKTFKLNEYYHDGKIIKIKSKYYIITYNENRIYLLDLKGELIFKYKISSFIPETYTIYGIESKEVYLYNSKEPVIAILVRFKNYYNRSLISIFTRKGELIYQEMITWTSAMSKLKLNKSDTKEILVLGNKTEGIWYYERNNQ